MARLSIREVVVEFPIYNTTKMFSTEFVSTVTGGIISRNNDSKTVLVRALDNISVEVEPGDRLGLIGPNGAGKSTLLRVMAGIYPPASGEVEIEGEVSQLFDISLGMAMDDTGYENIGNIFRYYGLFEAQIKEKIPQVSEFSELGEFLNLPIRTYSTGMLTRLSFSIATSIDPEILLLDEGLGAGDARFADKVKSRVDHLMETSSLMVLASHSDTMISDFCNKAIFLDKGKAIAHGDVEEVCKIYRDRTGAT